MNSEPGGQGDSSHRRRQLLDISDLEDSVVLALTNSSSLSSDQLAERVAVRSDAVQDCADGLVVRGLVSRLSSTDGYQIIDPGVSFQGPVRQLEKQVGDVREWVANLTTRHRNRVASYTDSFVEVVADRESARELVRSTHANSMRPTKGPRARKLTGPRTEEHHGQAGN